MFSSDLFFRWAFGVSLALTYALAWFVADGQSIHVHGTVPPANALLPVPVPALDVRMDLNPVARYIAICLLVLCVIGGLMVYMSVKHGDLIDSMFTCGILIVIVACLIGTFFAVISNVWVFPSVTEQRRVQDGLPPGWVVLADTQEMCGNVSSRGGPWWHFTLPSENVSWIKPGFIQDCYPGFFQEFATCCVLVSVDTSNLPPVHFSVILLQMSAMVVATTGGTVLCTALGAEYTTRRRLDENPADTRYQRM